MNLQMVTVVNAAGSGPVIERASRRYINSYM